MTFTKEDVIENIQDVSGNWRVRLRISDSECIFLKFATKPTLAKIKVAANNFLIIRETEEKERKKQLKIQEIQDKLVQKIKEKVNNGAINTIVQELKNVIANGE